MNHTLPDLVMKPETVLNKFTLLYSLSIKISKVVVQLKTKMNTIIGLHHPPTTTTPTAHKLLDQFQA